MNRSFVDGTVDPAKFGQAFMDLLGQFAAENVQKAQTVGAPVGPYVHGPGGLFGVRGLERDVISTHTQITGSLGEVIPIQSSIDVNPLFPYITGFLRSDQQEKNAVCDDPAQAANFKTCIQTTVFGRKEFKTRQVEINRIGQRINRGEFMDLNLLNGPLVDSMGGLMQSFLGLSNQNSILAGREMVMRLVEVGVAYQRWFCPTVYTGNPANSSAGGGYKEFPGLDLLISRTKIDALTGAACPSLYSDVKDFGYRQVSSATDPDIVRTITTMFRILNRKAEQQGLSPVDLRIVMREPLFYELTRVWPCIYSTDACNAAAQGTMTASNNVDASAMVRFRDEMRNGKYLMIDGRRVGVTLDDCIMEDNRADNPAIPIGGFASDIYFVPFTARGGTIRTLYWEYYDYRNDVIPGAGDVRAAPTFFWSDGGVFLWGLKAPDNWCVEAISKTEPRLILRTPQLAGRLQNVVYVPLQHTDDPLPSQDYHVNGGVSTGRPFASPFSEWNLSGPGSGA
jgi:hypothetical protein